MKAQPGKLTTEDIDRLKENSSGEDLYRAHKTDIKDKFFEMIAHPEHYGFVGQVAADLKQVATDKDHSKISWKVTKSNMKEQLNNLTKDNVTELLLEDLMDAKVAVDNMYTFKAILKKPADPNFNLEPEMIEYIKNLKMEDKNNLIESIAKAEHLQVSEEVLFHANHLQNFGHNLANAAYNLWDKMEPLVMNLLGTLSKIGFTILADLVTKNVAEHINKPLSEAVHDTGEVLGDFFHKGEYKADHNPLISSVRVDHFINDMNALSIAGDNNPTVPDHQ